MPEDRQQTSQLIASNNVGTVCWCYCCQTFRCHLPDVTLRFNPTAFFAFRQVVRQVCSDLYWWEREGKEEPSFVTMWVGIPSTLLKLTPTEFSELHNLIEQSYTQILLYHPESWPDYLLN